MCHHLSGSFAGTVLTEQMKAARSRIWRRNVPQSLETQNRITDRGGCKLLLNLFGNTNRLMCLRVSIELLGILEECLSLRIQKYLKKGISPTILFWGWDSDHQSYSREGSGFLGCIKSWFTKTAGLCWRKWESLTLKHPSTTKLVLWRGGFRGFHPGREKGNFTYLNMKFKLIKWDWYVYLYMKTTQFKKEMYPKNHGIWSSWWFGDPVYPCEKHIPTSQIRRVTRDSQGR